MVRKFVSATVSAALCLATMAPAAAVAQEYRFTGFDAPRGATATFNIRVPMGPEHRERASYGLTLGYGQSAGTTDMSGLTTSRAFRFADLRFSGDRLREANVASFDLANLDEDRRVSNLTGADATLWTVALVVGAGALICFVVTDCFGGDGDDEPN